MTTATNVLDKLQSRAPGIGLPRDFYTDDAIYRLVHRDAVAGVDYEVEELFVDWYCRRLDARLQAEELTDVA
jgi:hypothetical protein